jgi:hypothetical protein
MNMDETIRKIRLAILEDAEASTDAMRGMHHATDAERTIYEQRLEQIDAMKAELSLAPTMEDLNACVSDALDSLEQGDTSGAIGALKAAAEAIRQVL